MSLSHLIEHTTLRKVGPLSLIGLVLIPLLIAGGFVLATWDSDTRMDRVTAAIVNNDEPVELNDQLVPLGRQLAGGLVTGAAATDSNGEADSANETESDDETEPEQNYDWVLSDTEDAEAGLKSGKYAAVVTIPENFSAAATSYSKEDPNEAEQATLEVQVSDQTKIVDPAMSQAIVAAATTSMNSQLTTSYLDNIYIGFNDLSKQFTKIADAAGQFDDGATGLADGLTETGKGATELTSGLKELSTGAGQLDGGASELSDGVDQLSTGLDQLATGTKDLPSQTRQLSDGTTGIADGAKQLAGGTKELSSGAAQLSDATGQLSTGATGLSQGTKEISKGAAQLASGTKDLSGGAKQLSGGAREVAAGATQLNQGMPALADGSQQVAQGADGLSGGLQSYQGAMKQLPQQITCAAAEITDPAVCAGFEAGVKAASDAAAQGLEAPGPQGSPSLLQGADQLAQGANGLAAGINGTDQQPGLVAGVDGLATGTKEIANGAAGLADGAKQLNTGAQGLADGAKEVNGGAKGLAKGMKQVDTGVDGLASGAKQLNGGARELASGSKELAGGMDQFADGMPTLTNGISESASGAGQLATGAAQLSDGVTGIADGAKGAADGSAQLSDGIGQLSDGAAQLADGTGELHKGVKEGADAVPTYTEPERENLAEVVAAPVGDGDEEPTIFSDVSAGAFISVVALWLGGLATYLVVRAVSSRTLSSTRSSALIALQGLIPGMAISVIPAIGLSLIMLSLLDLSGSQFAALTPLLVLAGVTFAAINHALVALLGGVGRFVSMILVVASAAGSLLSAVPEFFDSVRGLLPLTPALDATMAIAGSGADLGGDIAMLFAWLGGAIVVSILAVVRKRTVSAAQLVA